jgi:translation initiation factor 3 subunit C
VEKVSKKEKKSDGTRPRKEKSDKKSALQDPKESGIEWTVETVQKKVDEVIASRGKKGTKVQAQIELLRNLANLSESKHQRLAIMLHITSTRFDSATNLNTFMALDVWADCLKDLEEILNTLAADSDLMARDDSQAPPVPEPGILETPPLFSYT